MDIAQGVVHSLFPIVAKNTIPAGVEATRSKPHRAGGGLVDCHDGVTGQPILFCERNEFFAIVSTDTTPLHPKSPLTPANASRSTEQNGLASSVSS